MRSARPSRLSALLNRGVQVAMATESRRFARALRDPERAQRERLAAILSAVRGSGQAGALARVTSPAEFQDALPIATRESVKPLIDAVAQGSLNTLTGEAPVRFELSGGSSGASRYLPVTRAFLGELHRALAPWLFDLLNGWPAIRSGPAYWSISPIGTRQGRTNGGTPVGSESDASYFPPLLRPLIDRVLAVPGALAQLPDVESCRYVTLRCLLQRADVAFISCWNPSFLTLLLEAFDLHADALIEDLRAGTCRPPMMEGALPAGFAFAPAPGEADRLAALVRQGRVTAAALFPNLSLVSTWTDAEAARSLPALQERLGPVALQGKGLLATEGVVTIPMRAAPAPVLAVRSHFYEFVDVDAPSLRPLLAHELSAGRDYDVLLSTSSGLLRYRLGDRVRVAGFLQQTPCLRFLGRSDAVVDLVGEKLSAAQASEALSAASLADARFAMLSPEWTQPPAYHLHLDADVDDATLVRVAALVDAELKKAHAYEYARRLGQLGPVVAQRVREGARRYEARCISLGQRAGDIKPTALHGASGWSEWFSDAIPLKRSA